MLRVLVFRRVNEHQKCDPLELSLYLYRLKIVFRRFKLSHINVNVSVLIQIRLIVSIIEVEWYYIVTDNSFHLISYSKSFVKVLTRIQTVI